MEKEKVLIVEDEIIIGRDTESRLIKMGYTVTGIAESHDEALESIEKEKPDLILMDIMISGPLDGITTAIEVWDRFKIPIIFQTAYADDVTLSRARSTEFYGYLVKPIKENEFKIAVENALFKAHGNTGMKLSAGYFQSLLESLPAGIISADKDGVIAYMNKAARSLLEVSDDLTGINISEVFLKDGEPKQEPESCSCSCGLLNKSVKWILKNGSKINTIYGVYNITQKNERKGMEIIFTKVK